MSLPNPDSFQLLETTVFTEHDGRYSSDDEPPGLQGEGEGERQRSGLGPWLLEDHLARMRRSSELLSASYGFPCFQVAMEQREVEQAIRREVARAGAEGGSEDGSTRYRIRMLLHSGGELAVQATLEPVAPTAGRAGPIKVVLDTEPSDTESVFTACKTTHRDIYARAAERVAGELQCIGGGLVLLFNGRGEITETNIANIAVSTMAADGALVLVTPALSSGLLAGTVRARMLSEGRAVEGIVGVDQLRQAAKNGWPIVCMNSVRGEFAVEVVLRD
ncbi:hypothetical protein GGI07_004555 [Coemansia sp. Benny D115]|nr:hypothetical protein GGI07_004555 [Coemansia sp. Benny D115]